MRAGTRPPRRATPSTGTPFRPAMRGTRAAPVRCRCCPRSGRAPGHPPTPRPAPCQSRAQAIVLPSRSSRPVRG
ncbi:hypothetical protein E3T43_16040 [Cryobacterium sp. Hh7]|nr:hypothetical protein E3T43_16040 [Cryobacterium sp. Hh7]